MGRPDQTQSPRMGRPDETPSPRMNSNFNPMFHAQPPPEPPPPVHEKQMVQTAQRYPNKGGRVNQQNQVPMARPGQPPYIYTNAIVNQPHVVAVPMARPVHFIHPQPSNWTSGLCDCFDDPVNAMITWCCPCITFGQIAEIIDEGATSCGMAGMLYILILAFFWVPCVYTCTYRTKLRNKFGLPEAPAPDCITHFFCEYCAICQAYRELNNRGLDPAIGWMGNVQRQRMSQQQEMMAPPMAQRMTG